jgi:hypothetical protein
MRFMLAWAKGNQINEIIPKTFSKSTCITDVSVHEEENWS